MVPTSVMRGCDLSRLHDGQIGGLLILENANRAIERGLPEHAQFGTYPFFVRLSDKSSAAQIVCEICPLSPREIFVALVSVLDNLAVGLIIVPVVYLCKRRSKNPSLKRPNGSVAPE